ncbi:MAG: hypothetical protein IKE58_06295 [Blautia sp.]|nr:hypothetical protein [Blautia sp.]
MEEQKMTILIPEGCFMGNCTDCRYANWNDTNSQGYPHCDGNYGGYNNPRNRNGCFHYVKK